MQMHRTRSSIALAATTALFALLVGACGSAPAPTSAPDTTSAPAASVATSAPAATGEQVTLKYVSWMAKGEDKPILADFMKQYPNIKVEDQVLDGGTYDALLKPRFTGGDAPDVFLFMASQYGAFVKEGWLMDVTSEPGTAPMKSLQPLADSYTIGGKIYGTMVNGNYNSMPVYYNKKYFAAKSLSVPTTLDEFMALAEKIKADGVDPIVMGGKDAWTVNLFNLPYSENAIHGKFGGSNTDLKLVKGEATVADVYGGTLKFFGDVLQKGYVSKASASLTYDQSVQYFVDGKAGLLVQGPWIPGVDQVKTANAGTFELGAFPMPVAPINGTRHTSAGSDRSIGISASTKHPAEARLLYNFFLDKANIKKYLETQSLTTIVPGINPDVAPALQDYIKQVSDPSKYTVYIGSTDKVNVAMPAAWNEAIGGVYADMLAGATADEELQKLQDTFEKVKGQATIQNQ